MFRDLDQDKSCGLNAKEVQQGLAKLHIDVPEDELGTHFTVGDAVGWVGLGFCTVNAAVGPIAL
jgi:hypothetical protein